jgi:hypothetical protein
MKPVEVILRRRKGKRENSGEEESNCGRLYTYMEKSQ